MFRYCKSDKFTNNSFLRVQKNPRNTRFLGYLTFGHKLSYDNKSIFRLYYSMIVATRPDPTVRPPARYLYFVCTPFWSMLNSSFCVLRIIIKYHSTNTKAHDRYHPCHYTAINSPLQNTGLCPYNSKRICGNMTNHGRIHMP